MHYGKVLDNVILFDEHIMREEVIGVSLKYIFWKNPDDDDDVIAF